MRGITLKLSAVITILLTAALSACSTGADTPPDGPQGPWAAEIQQLSEDSPSTFADQVFADGKVTDQEYAEAKGIVQKCFDSTGFDVVWDEYGRESVSGQGTPGMDGMDAISKCAFSDGGVMVMYHQMLLNPENEDQTKLWTACLVRTGVVGPDFTETDLNEAFEAESLPWQPSDERGLKCMSDPLGVLE
ncbi:hypothetical protein EDF62_1620 [Leucobacter luti]|uniref:LppA-like lipoprotein n=1 Tax=Leucobacter luti TaxID=340320 RepID=A0A4R6RZM8_9MICO|nr:hypothetical protein [Leucobacter luti]TDP92413.1 hypothetical protein EDF62_1620 [Leucobacter luti]